MEHDTFDGEAGVPQLKDASQMLYEAAQKICAGHAAQVGEESVALDGIHVIVTMRHQSGSQCEVQLRATPFPADATREDLWDWL